MPSSLAGALSPCWQDQRLTHEIAHRDSLTVYMNGEAVDRPDEPIRSEQHQSGESLVSPRAAHDHHTEDD